MSFLPAEEEPPIWHRLTKQLTPKLLIIFLGALLTVSPQVALAAKPKPFVFYPYKPPVEPEVFLVKPIIIKTEMGTPEKELLAKQAERFKYSYSSGNSYPVAYCTWLAKSKRPDLPNALGNARNWLNSASAAGFTIGQEPKPGAVMVTSESGLGHVAVVTWVDGDQFGVIERNYVGLGVDSTRSLNRNYGAIRGFIY